jgi:hypothetical protein
MEEAGDARRERGGVANGSSGQGVDIAAGAPGRPPDITVA